QHVEPPTESKSIEVGDYIEVRAGEHLGKRGIVEWFPIGGISLWFLCQNYISTGDDEESSVKLQRIRVPATMVQRAYIPSTLKYTKEKGYDIRPGDVVRVVRGPEYQTKGVVQSVDFPNARLNLLSDVDRSLINVPIRFVMKICNTSLDSFNNVIGQEVFIIAGARKGYRATLYGLALDTCSIAVHGQARTTLKLKDIATRSITPPPEKTVLAPSITPSPVDSSSSAVTAPSRSSMWDVWSANSAIDIADKSPVTPSSSMFDPWTVNVEDNIDASTEELPGPLSWLIGKEFSSLLTMYHAVLKVSLRFMNGRLHNRFVSTACPDPFLGDNGPTPEGSVAAFCTSSNFGGALQHYHIPAKDLSPAPPRKKNQECLVLDGTSRGQIITIVKCNIKKMTAELAITPRSSSTLRFDQMCLVERAQMPQR
ncbi:uncharacterized protein F5891DRAFT_991511, partial [Suillus fuscotomentosus]